MATYKLFLLPGDGIGPEVMAEAEKVIAFFNAEGGARFETEKGLVGGCAFDAHGASISEADMERAQASDAILFGAVGGPKWANVPYEARPEAGLLRLRKDLQLYANLRPAVCYPALASASSLKPEVVEGLDILILRELTGGVYFGEPKTITDLGNGQKRAIDTQVYDTYEIERIGRVAFDLARKRRNKVTSSEKHNVMKSGVLWKEVITALHKREFPDVQLEHQLADALGMQLVRWPKQFDVIVCDNLFGDMLSDVAAMLTGSLGMLPSASLGDVDPKTRQAQGALRARAWLGARHRRQGRGQPDRDDRLVRDVPALFVRAGRRGGSAGGGDRLGVGAGAAHEGHRGAGRGDGLDERDGGCDRGGAGGLTSAGDARCRTDPTSSSNGRNHERKFRGHPAFGLSHAIANRRAYDPRERGVHRVVGKLSAVGAVGRRIAPRTQSDRARRRAKLSRRCASHRLRGSD